MPLSLVQTVAPTVEPVTTAQMKRWLRIETSDENDDVDLAIAAARLAVEAWTNRSLVSATFTLKLDAFPPARRPDVVDPRNPTISVVSRAEILIPVSPLVSATIAYLRESDGNSTALGTSIYDVETDSLPGRILLAFDQTWPAIRRTRHAVTVTFVAGYGTSAGDVPENARLAVQMLAADLFEHRTAQTEIRIDQNRVVADLLADIVVPEVF